MRALWLANLLFPVMRRLADRREPSATIIDNVSPAPYLYRWHVLPRGSWWRPSLYLHRMIKDDGAVLHDHPYYSFSIVLRGMIRERYQLHPPSGEILERNLFPGDLVVRSSRFAHQLLLPCGDAWTLFFVGRRLPKEWGFWCPRGFTHFLEYFRLRNAKLKAGDMDALGGCGED